MADYTQSKSVIIAHQAVTNPESVTGSAVSVASSLSGTIVCRHAYIEALDPGGIEPSFHIMGSHDASGDDAWFEILELTCVDPGAAPATEAMTATEPIGETVLAVASTSGFAAGDNIYVQDTVTEADSEWHKVDRVVTNTSVDIYNGLVAQKDSSDVLWGSAQAFAVSLSFQGFSRINVYYSNEGSSAPNTAVLVELLQSTDIE